MRKIGYLRVSSAEQSPDRQIDGLAALCDELHVEHASAVSPSRPIYEQAVATLCPGDMLLVWDLDRAFRSVVDALLELERLRERGIALTIVNLQIDTTTPSGMLVYTVMSAFAEFERRLLSQRTKEGIAAARRRGKKIGRPRKLADDQLQDARYRLDVQGETRRHVASLLEVSPWTLTRALRRNARETANQHRAHP